MRFTTLGREAHFNLSTKNPPVLYFAYASKEVKLRTGRRGGKWGWESDKEGGLKRTVLSPDEEDSQPHWPWRRSVRNFTNEEGRLVVVCCSNSLTTQQWTLIWSLLFHVKSLKETYALGVSEGGSSFWSLRRRLLLWVPPKEASLQDFWRRLLFFVSWKKTPLNVFFIQFVSSTHFYFYLELILILIR